MTPTGVEFYLIFLNTAWDCSQIDEQDAEERAQLRRKQIASANKMLYDDTDRPKALHSKLLLSDVMHERVRQMEYAQQIKALKQQQHDAFLVQQAAQLKVETNSPRTQSLFALRQSRDNLTVRSPFVLYCVGSLPCRFGPSTQVDHITSLRQCFWYTGLLIELGWSPSIA